MIVCAGKLMVPHCVITSYQSIKQTLGVYKGVGWGVRD